MRLLSMTLTGMVLTSGMGQAGDRSFGETNGADEHPGTAIVAVNQDQLQGKWKQFKGEFTDDDLLAIEGSVDKLEGKIQERYGDRREDVKRWVDEWFDTHGTQREQSPS
jgi:uncharacterized protein YjbJ (UPF0337 family)